MVDMVHSPFRSTPTLANLLCQLACDQASKLVFSFVQDDLSIRELTYAKLYQAASAVALQLSEHADRGGDVPPRVERVS